MSDSELIEKFQAETHYQLGNDVIQDLINMVREHDADNPRFLSDVVASEISKEREHIKAKERAKTLAEVREAVEAALSALKLKKGDYTSIKRLVDIPAEDYNKVIDTTIEISSKAIDGVEK